MGSRTHLTGLTIVAYFSVTCLACTSLFSPLSFIFARSWGLISSIMSNPTPESFERACCLGERATWPKVSVILNQLKIELALDDIVQSLRGLERWQLV